MYDAKKHRALGQAEKSITYMHITMSKREHVDYVSLCKLKV